MNSLKIPLFIPFFKYFNFSGELCFFVTSRETVMFCFLLGLPLCSYLFLLNMVALTPKDQILKTEINRVPILEKWHDDRVVLLVGDSLFPILGCEFFTDLNQQQGDACHATAPNLAQGAGLSIEDAVELAFQIKQFNEKQGKASLSGNEQP